MKLYELPRNTKFHLGDKTVFILDHIDGMYSLCYDEDNNIHHIAAYTDVVSEHDENWDC